MVEDEEAVKAEAEKEVVKEVTDMKEKMVAKVEMLVEVEEEGDASGPLSLEGA